MVEILSVGKSYHGRPKLCQIISGGFLVCQGESTYTRRTKGSGVGQDDACGRDSHSYQAPKPTHLNTIQQVCVGQPQWARTRQIRYTEAGEESSTSDDSPISPCQSVVYFSPGLPFRPRPPRSKLLLPWSWAGKR